MYMSRVVIDTENRRKIRSLSHLGAFHDWVESSFPDEKEEGIRSRKLWRLDRLNGKVYLLVVSRNKPDLPSLERYGVPGSAETKSYDSFLEEIHEGRVYRFRVTLNPVRSISRGEGKRGRVVPEVTADQQLEFLRRKSQKCGFELFDGSCRITERGYGVQRKKGEAPIRLSKATFEGMLEVKDAALFKDALTNGIGRKKAYGFGLMTVIPVK